MYTFVREEPFSDIPPLSLDRSTCSHTGDNHDADFRTPGCVARLAEVVALANVDRVPGSVDCERDPTCPKYFALSAELICALGRCRDCSYS